MNDLYFRSAAHNGLVAYYLLHYLPQQSWQQVFAGFARVLRPGGRLLIVMKKGEGEGWIRDPLGGDIDTFWAACSAEELEGLLQSAGLRVIDSHTRLPLPQEIAVDRFYLHAERVNRSS
jgi:SAM-dependent methyltransferase